jgi:hypothetical protein
MKKLGLFFLLTLAACSTPAPVGPTIDYGKEYLAIAAIYNEAVDKFDPDQRDDIKWLNGWAADMTEATRTVEERLVAIEWPEEIEDQIDEIIEYEAAAHIAYGRMSFEKDLISANDALGRANEAYSEATNYSEVVRVKLGLPPIKLHPWHYL